VARSYICRCFSIHAAVVLASTPPPSIAAVWDPGCCVLLNPKSAAHSPWGWGCGLWGLSRFDHR
jgi:hypothetical protein